MGSAVWRSGFSHVGKFALPIGDEGALLACVRQRITVIRLTLVCTAAALSAAVAVVAAAAAANTAMLNAVYQ